ncbi:MAG: hypothetical protein KAQ98_07190 [Bacteriovoracaceae bacterium]|nr:hypothetical protein [Bacteriovoracaceae bacterium]
MKGIMSIFVTAALVVLFFHVENIHASAEIKELIQVRDNVFWYEKEIGKIKRKLKRNLSEMMRTRTEVRLADLIGKRQKVRHQFIEIVSGVDIPAEYDLKEKVKRDIFVEVQELLMPVLDGVRRASERPRKIGKLKSEIESISVNLGSRMSAAEKIKNLVSEEKYFPVKKELKRSLSLLDEKIREMKVELDSRERALKKELGEKVSVIDMVKNLFSSFFRTKGKNLLFALTSLISIFWVLIFLRKKIFNLSVFKGPLNTALKPLKAVYSTIALIFAVSGAVLCLYLMNDWVLVTIIIVIFVGLLWSLKQFIPQFVGEARLILNLGSVREGERIVLNGLPWKVIRLGFYSKLVNERLSGGAIRMPAGELMKCQSRKFSKNEEWFPTETGDWVLLDGGIYGKVERQGPEFVVIRLKGKSKKYIKTSEFLNMNPQNLSGGFRICQVFGLDYGIQKDILKATIPVFQSKFREKFLSDGKFSGKISDVVCEFDSAGAHSLNLWVKVDCDALLAGNYQKIKRCMSECFVEICNEENLSIPFEQLTIHKAN